MNEQEHRCRVGRGHHRADQERFHPIEAEQVMRRRRGQRRREQDADGREHEGRRDDAAEGRKPRAQAAVEQDQRQRHRADQVGRVDVIERDPAGTGFAGEHADQEEHQQQRRTEPQGDEARQDAGQHQQCAEHDGKAYGIERCHRSIPGRRCAKQACNQYRIRHKFHRTFPSPTLGRVAERSKVGWGSRARTSKGRRNPTVPPEDREGFRSPAAPPGSAVARTRPCRRP